MLLLQQSESIPHCPSPNPVQPRLAASRGIFFQSICRFHSLHSLAWRQSTGSFILLELVELVTSRGVSLKFLTLAESMKRST